MRVLLLAGTTEARALSRQLASWPDVDLTVSLAGLTSEVAPHGGRLRSGGFGGAGGLEKHLRDERVDAVIDGTHPFAATMPRHATAAARRCGIPRLRLCRPPWRAVAGDRWSEVDDLGAAADALCQLGPERVLLTVGRLGLDAFRAVPEVTFVIRSIEPLDAMQLPSAEIVRARGPFGVDAEVALLRDHRIDVLVTKNSGGDDAKLVAARRTATPVVMVRRPPSVDGPHASTVEEAAAWLSALLRHGRGDTTHPGRGLPPATRGH